MVKHAGLNPTENTSGQFKGQTRISKRGRPRLRLAAWRAAWSLVQHNQVAAARHAHLTSRDTNPLTDTQARVAIAAATLRWIHAIVTRRVAWDPGIAAGTWEHETIAA